MNGFGRSSLSSGMALVLIAAAVGVPAAAAAPSEVDRVTPALLDEAEAAAAAEDTPAAGQIKLQKRQSASAVAERKRSKTAYGQTDRQGVERLLRDRFAGQLATAAASGTKLDDGWRVVKRVGAFGEALVSDGGQRRYVTSSVPLSTGGVEGTLVPVDLRLARTSNGWKSAAAASDVLFPDQLGDGLRFADGQVSLRLRDDAAAVKVDGVDAVVYPDAVSGEDADFVATPTAAGLETFVQVRSATAAESATLHFALPAATTLSGRSDGGVDMVRAGQVIATVLSPHGNDADGQAIEVEMDVKGSTIVLSYPHRGLDLRYPLLIDPSIIDTTVEESSWSSLATDGSMFSFQRDQNGLVITKGEGFQSGRNFGQWEYRLPHNGTPVPNTSPQQYETTTARIASLQATRQNAGAYGEDAQNPYVINGILNGGSWADVWSRSLVWSFVDSDGPVLRVPGDPLASSNAEAKTALVALDHPAAGTRYNPSYSAFAGTSVAIADPEGATVDPIASPAGFRSASFTIPVTGRDPGVGVYSFALLRADGEAVENYSPSSGAADYCDGRAANPCPQVRTHNFGINPQNPALSEGVNHLSMCAYDLVLNIPTQCATFDVSVDRTKPVVTLSGRAWEARVREDGSYPENLTVGGTYPFEVSARDPLSGVSKVTAYVDGEPLGAQHSRPNACAGDGCAQVETFTLNGSDYASGDHLVEIQVSDRVGNPTTVERFTFYERYDGAAPGRGMSKGDGTATGQDDTSPTTSPDPEMQDPPCSPDDPDCAPEDPTNEATLEAMDEPGGTRMTWPAAPLPGALSGSRAGATVNGVSGANFWAMSNQRVPFDCRRSVTGVADLTAQERLTDLNRAEFTDLKVRQIRYILPYDAILAMDPNDPDKVLPTATPENKCQWLKWRIYYRSAQQTVGIAQILVSIGQKIGGDMKTSDLPSPDLYRSLVTRFRRTHLEIRRYTAWNEPDIVAATASRLVDPATGRSGPEFAAIYWRRLNKLCNDTRRPQVEKDMPCTVAAWDATDRPWSSGVAPQESYFNVYKSHLNGRPSIWAIHTYGSNRFGSLGRLRGFLRATHQVRNTSKIWITEGGAVVRISGGGPDFIQTPADARNNFEGSVNKLTSDAAFDRITRFYYHTLGGDKLAAPQGPPGQPPIAQPGAPNGGTQVSNFDTGLLSPYDPSEPKRGVYCDYQRRNNPNGAANCVAPASY